MSQPRSSFTLVGCLLGGLVALASAQERAALFAIPDFTALPPEVQVRSERTVEGVVISELTLAGAPFNGRPTRIYGFYCRPATAGRHPAVLEVHGAGLGVLTPAAGIAYAKAGFCSFTLDWAGVCRDRTEPRQAPFSLFDSPGNLARPMPEPQNHPPHGWKTYGPEADGIRNGVLFARRATLFLASQPEVDPERLCISGMSAGAHLTLLICGVEPRFKAAAVKYGRGFIRELAFGGYFGPILMCPRPQQDEWLAAFDPQHGLADYRAKVLMLSGTADVFFWMPGVLATWRAIPTDKRLVMFPNENHGYVGNVAIPLAWFRACLGLAPAWPVPQPPTLTPTGAELRLSLNVQGPEVITGATFVVKRLPKPDAIHDFALADKNRPETLVAWSEIPATRSGEAWIASLPALKPGEQVVVYANVTDALGRSTASDTSELPDYPEWHGRRPDSGWSQVFKATEFKRAGLADPTRQEAVRRCGNLRGLAKDEKGEPVIGWYEFDQWAPHDGWYELTVPGGDGVEYAFSSDPAASPDRAAGTDSQGRVGTFWLRQGPTTLRLERTHWTGFPALSEFKLRALGQAEVAGKVRVTVADGRSILRRGESLRLLVQSGDLAQPAALGVRLVQGGTVLGEQTITLPDWPGQRTVQVDLPCPAAGACTVEFLVDGTATGQRNLQAVPVLVVDTAVQSASGGLLATTPVVAIDCTTAAPDYSAGGTRVVTTSAGTYRETGAVGYLNHLNPSEPHWFAYRVQVPARQRLYRIEVDYPDDALRSFVIAVREAATDAYPTAGGVDSGGEFSLGGGLQTHTLLHWARTTDLRVLVIPGRDGMRAAAARIRVAQVEGELPLPPVPARGGRAFANWYEEGSNFAAVFGAPDRTLPGLSIAAERWARTMRHMGADCLWMTMAVYQFGLYPSRYNLQFGSRNSPDLVRTVLLNCERYGLGFIGEFHPEARELAWPANADPAGQHLARSRQGLTREKRTEPAFSVLWPANRAWYLGMIGEFVDRYQDSPSLRGVCLRLMDWCNPGLNNFHNLDWGYDDYTCGLFERESGLRIPVEASDPRRFAGRQDWLLANQRQAWITWRCGKIEELFREVVARVRQTRPDLMVYANWMLPVAEPREAGIDPVRLQAIPGVVLTGGTGYGRRLGDVAVLQGTRDTLLDPDQLRRLAAGDGRGAFLNGAVYFEATGEVVIPEDLGFPKSTPRPWMSGVVNPAGRHANERWAVQLAGTDACFLADGGNAYTVGQPVLREFLADYRWIPALPFQLREDASDPVAVWSREVATSDLAGIGAEGLAPGFHFYAVNRERYAVRVVLELAGAGASVARPASGGMVPLAAGRLVVDLAPYEVRSFRAGSGASLKGVQVTVPEAARHHAQALADHLTRLAGEVASGTAGVGLRPEQAALLAGRAALARAELAKGHLWRVRTLAEERGLLEIYARLQRQPPELRELGAVAPPPGAMQPEDLLKNLRVGRAEIVPAAQVAPLWPGDHLLLSRDERLEFAVAVETDGLNGLHLGCLSGGEYGAIEVSVDGTVVGSVGSGGGALRSLSAFPGRPVLLRRGTLRIGLRRIAGTAMALRFLVPVPVFTDLVAESWSAVGPFRACPAERQEWDLTYKQLMTGMHTARWSAAEDGCDPLASYPAGERTLRWTPLHGDADFIDLGAALSGTLGTISYAATRIESPRPARVRLRFGVDYYIRIWLNGELVQDVDVQSGMPFKARFTADVSLRQGANELLVKVASGSGANGFWMELGDTGDLRVSSPAAGGK